MKSLSRFTYILFLSLFFISSLPPSQANNLRFLSDFGDIGIRCQSKDDDLRSRNLQPCQVQEIRHYKMFDVFTQDRDKNHYGSDCKWSIRDDGIYFSNDGTTWALEYTWEVPN
ncbi:hypothetical protein ACJRO7_013647 [Eucalyptus globulus]|uniref:S-protein homolog n=1 Tax=Eucalyptus globulus TaxID=34317 RepID=A0ABD3L3K3_EUCGL